MNKIFIFLLLCMSTISHSKSTKINDFIGSYEVNHETSEEACSDHLRAFEISKSLTEDIYFMKSESRNDTEAFKEILNTQNKTIRSISRSGYTTKHIFKYRLTGRKLLSNVKIHTLHKPIYTSITWDAIKRVFKLNKKKSQLSLYVKYFNITYRGVWYRGKYALNCNYDKVN